MTVSKKGLNTADLSDYQLYQLIQNKKLDSIIRQAASDEFQKRNLSIDQVELLQASHTFQFPDETTDKPTASYKLALVAFPFSTIVHSLIAGRMLAKRQPRKWKDYWLYVCLGYLLWTIVVLLYAWFDSFR